MIKVKGSLRRHTLRVTVLVLYDTEHRRIVVVEQFGNAPTALSKHKTLCRRRRLDDIRRIAEVFRHQLTLRQFERLNDVAREKSVLSADTGIE